MDTCTKLAVEDAVDVKRGEFRVVGKQLVDGLFNLGKPGGGILELQQLLDAEELAAFENGLVLMVNKYVTIRSVCLADEHKADAKLLLQVGSKLFLVGTEITVLLQDGTQLLTSPVVGAVIFQYVLHDELHRYRTQLSPTTIQMYNRLLVIILTVIAQTLHDGTEMRLGRVSISKWLFNNVVYFRLLLLTSVPLHYLLCNLMRTPLLVVMVNLMPFGSHTEIGRAHV